MCCRPSFLRPIGCYPRTALCYSVPPLLLLDRPMPSCFSASAFLAQSCSINCCANARTCSSLSSKARMNGSIAPGGASRAQASRARSRTRTFGELSFWVISSGTTKPSTGCPGAEERSGAVLGLTPPGAVPFPEATPDSFPEARGIEIAAWPTGVNELLPGDEPCLDRGCPPTLARDPRLGALSDEVCPQPTNPARSIRLRSSARYDSDGRMSSDRSGGAKTIRCTGPAVLHLELDLKGYIADIKPKAPNYP